MAYYSLSDADISLFCKRKYKNNANNLETIKFNKTPDLIFNNNNNLPQKNNKNKFTTSTNVKCLMKNKHINNMSIIKTQLQPVKIFFKKINNIFNIIRNKSRTCFKLTDEYIKLHSKIMIIKKLINIFIKQ